MTDDMQATAAPDLAPLATPVDAAATAAVSAAAEHPAHTLLDEIESLMALAESSIETAVKALVARIRQAL